MNNKHPYYLQECSCGNLNHCKICRSKYNRQVTIKRNTREFLREQSLYYSERRKNESPEEREHRLKKNREYWNNLSPEKREELRLKKIAYGREYRKLKYL